MSEAPTWTIIVKRCHAGSEPRTDCHIYYLESGLTFKRRVLVFAGQLHQKRLFSGRRARSAIVNDEHVVSSFVVFWSCRFPYKNFEAPPKKFIGHMKGNSGRGRHRLGKQAGSLDRARRRRQVYSATFLHPANRLNGWSRKLDRWGGFRPSRRQLDFLGQGAMWGAGLGGRDLPSRPLENARGGGHPVGGHHGLPGALGVWAGGRTLAKPRAAKPAFPECLGGTDSPAHSSFG